MTMVSEYSWESDTFTHHAENAARTAWRAAVAEIAAKAKATLPDCAGRVDAAVKLVLAGDVELLPDGKAQVASQSNGTTVYHVVNGECTCRDFPKSPSGWCKHRIAAGLYKRAQALVQRQRDAGPTDQAEPPTPAAQPDSAPDGPTAALPEAPASVNVHLTIGGRQVQLTLRDADEARVLARLETILQRFPTPAPSGPAADTTPQCPTHGPMKPSTKGTGWYCAHKLPNGTWCPEKRR